MQRRRPAKVLGGAGGTRLGGCSPRRLFVTGHVARNNAAIATGIGLIFVGSLLLPLAVYLSGR